MSGQFAAARSIPLEGGYLVFVFVVTQVNDLVKAHGKSSFFHGGKRRNNANNGKQAENPFEKLSGKNNKQIFVRCQVLINHGIIE